MIKKTLLENYLFLLTEDPEMDTLDSAYKEIRNKIRTLGSNNPDGTPGADKLNSQYANTPKDQIPPNHLKKMEEYKAAVNKFDQIKRERDAYAKYMRNRSNGPKPGSSNRGFGSTGSSSRRGFGGTGSSSRGFGFDDSRFDDILRRHNERMRDINRNFEERMKDINKKYKERMDNINKERNERMVNIKKTHNERMAKINKTYKTSRNIRIMIIWSVLAAYLIEIIFAEYKLEKKRKEDLLRKKGLNQSEAERLSTISALESQIKRLKLNISKCNKTDDPQKCKDKIEERIQKLQIRINKLAKKG